MRSFFAIPLLFSVLVLGSGCGGNDGSTIIMPGPDYQLTEQEQANLEAEMAMRKGE